MSHPIAPFPDQVLRRIGSHTQLVSVEAATLTDGPGRGSRILIVRNPAGISLELLVDHALDIGWADSARIPLAWRSSAGNVSSDRYEPQGAGWVRTFAGGLLTTCGLSSTGQASLHGGDAHGLHGRVGNIPAQQVRWELLTVGREPYVKVQGRVVEAALGVPTLCMDRTVLISCKAPTLSVSDRVTNLSFTDAPHMFRHHLNLGFPIVDDGATVTSDLTYAGCRDHPEEGPPPREIRCDLSEPEHVWYYRMTGGTPHVRIRGAAGVGELDVSWSGDGFDRLILWRNANPGINVLGVEPSMSWDGGRRDAAADGDLTVLPPGSSVTYQTTIKHITTHHDSEFWRERSHGE